MQWTLSENLARHAMQCRAKGDVVHHLLELVTCMQPPYTTHTFSGASLDIPNESLSKNNKCWSLSGVPDSTRLNLFKLGSGRFTWVYIEKLYKPCVTKTLCKLKRLPWQKWIRFSIWSFSLGRLKDKKWLFVGLDSLLVPNGKLLVAVCHGDKGLTSLLVVVPIFCLSWYGELNPIVYLSGSLF